MVLSIDYHQIKDFILLISPFILLLIFVAFTYQNYVKNIKNEKKQKENPIALPIRLRAYERLALLLNRIEPKNLIVPEKDIAKDALDLKNQLIVKVQNEYNHNISQQIYVSDVLWETLIDTQNNLNELILAAYSKCTENDTPDFFAKILLDAYYSQEQTFIDATMIQLKSEVKDLY